MRLHAVRLAEHWKPVLVTGEVEKGVLEKVDLNFEEVGGVAEFPSDEYKGGHAVLTSLRVIWVTQQKAGSYGASCAVPLFAITETELKVPRVKLLASRIKMAVRLDEQGYPTADPRKAAKVEKLKLVTKASNVEAWHASLQQALSERAWSRAPGGSDRLSPERSQRSISSQSVRSSFSAMRGEGSPPRVPSSMRLSAGGHSSPPRVPSAQRLSGGQGSPPQRVPSAQRLSVGLPSPPRVPSSQRMSSPSRTPSVHGLPRPVPPPSPGPGLPSPQRSPLPPQPGPPQPWGAVPQPNASPQRSPQPGPPQPGPPQPWGAMLQQQASLSPSPQRAPQPLAPQSWGSLQQQPEQQQQQADPVMVHELTTMGFPSRHAANALAATKHAGVQSALEWLLAHAGSPLLDQPNAYGPYNPSLPDGVHASTYVPSPSGWGAAVAASSASAGGASWEYSPLGASMTAWHSSATGLAGAGPLSGYAYSATGEYSSSGAEWVHVESRNDGATTLNPLLAGMGVGGPPPPQQQTQQQQLAAQQRPHAAAPRQLSLGSVGVAGVLKREEQRAAETEHTMEQAFTDLSNLMTKAADMVQLAERFRTHINRKDVAAGGEEGEGEVLDAETALDLLSLGIVNPVTKESAGAQYQHQLARQLAEFLKGPVEHFGGMMPLPDVYCLFNRARGAELVSPDDVLQAVKLFPDVGAPFRLREFGSGIKVVQAASHSDEQVCAQLAAMVQPGEAGGAGAAPAAASGLGPGITSTDVAAALAVPLAVAGEHLLTAEARGVLCRDDGPEGLRFFRNFFTEAAA